jgi:hypothetical protein
MEVSLCILHLASWLLADRMADHAVVHGGSWWIMRWIMRWIMVTVGLEAVVRGLPVPVLSVVGRRSKIEDGDRYVPVVYEPYYRYS